MNVSGSALMLIYLTLFNAFRSLGYTGKGKR